MTIRRMEARDLAQVAPLATQLGYPSTESDLKGRFQELQASPTSGLFVAEAHVGKNLVMKRMHARARGRGVRVEKQFSQLTIVLRDTSAVAQTSEAA